MTSLLLGAAWLLLVLTCLVGSYEEHNNETTAR